LPILQQAIIDNRGSPDDIQFIAGLMPMLGDSKHIVVNSHTFYALPMYLQYWNDARRGS